MNPDNYREVPVNRTRDGITYYNLNWVNKIRVSGVSVEVLEERTRSELEVTSNQMAYLRVLRHEDELFLIYDFPGSGPNSGLNRIKDDIRIYLRQAVSAITAGDAGRVKVRDLMFTPFLEVKTDGAASVKCDVNAGQFYLYGDRASSFEGRVEAENVYVAMQGAAIAMVGGVSDELTIYTEGSASFTGENHRSKRVKAQADSKSTMRIGVTESLNATALNYGTIRYRPFSEIDIEKNEDSGGRIIEF